VERIEGLVRQIGASLAPEDVDPEEQQTEQRDWIIPSTLEDQFKAFRKSSQEKRAALVNPNYLQSPDEYTIGQIILGLEALSSPVDQIRFLRSIKERGAFFPEKLTRRLLHDRSPQIRAWVASNLWTSFDDYTDAANPVELANFESGIRKDVHPIVAASLWSNPHCRQLPWSLIDISEKWELQFRAFSSLDRLALMRNPDLSFKYVVALLNADTAELGITREEHANVVRAGAFNPRIVWSSRHHGRDFWVGFDGGGEAPFREFGQMWETSINRWLDIPSVPYAFLKFIQTTPRVKLAVYQQLLDMPESQSPKFLRVALIESCDPLTDKDVLKVAWNDPDKSCKEAAEKRVGNYRGFIGVKN
jgi:hypothetical protein